MNALSPSTDDLHFDPRMEDLLTKVVLARKTDLELSGSLDPWDLLSTLQVLFTSQIIELLGEAPVLV